MKKLINGVNPPLSNAEYHADKNYLSSSNLKLLYQDPAKFKHEYLDGNGKKLEGDFLTEGSAAHTLLFEPEKFDEEYAVFDGFRRDGLKWEEFKAKNPDKTLLTTPMLHRVKRYHESILRRPEALALVKDGMPEHTMTAKLQGVNIKARCDYIIPEKGIIVDLKTTSKPAGLELFKVSVDQYSYQLSAALYMQVAFEIYKRNFDFYFVVVSKPDLVTDVYKLSKESAAVGHHMVNKALQSYRRCMETGIWTQSTKPRGLTETISDYEIEEV